MTNLTLNKYQELSARTANKHDNERTNYALGLNGEAGEFGDLVKKEQFHDHVLAKENVRGELGDVLWYLSQLARVYDLTLEEVALANVEKLEKRYPQGFSAEDSVLRRDKS